MEIEKIFGEELRRVREEKNLSQEQLGFESGYHRTYISQLERGQKSASLKALFCLANALDEKASVLLAAVEARA